MKKRITLLALSAMMLLPNALMAESWTKYVTNKKEFEAAVDAIGGVQGETYEIIIAGPQQADGTYAVADASVVISGTNKTWSTATDGTVIIRSEQTDIDNLPRLQAGINMVDMPENNKFQFIFENVNMEYRAGNLATSGQIIYWSGNDPKPQDLGGKEEPIKKPIADAIIVRNCQITNIPRTFYRSVPGRIWNEELQDYEYAEVEKNHLRYFEISGCKIHDMNLANGNKWSLLVFGQAVDEIVIKNNIIYNLPFSKGLVEVSRVSDLGNDCKLTVENNTIFMGRPDPIKDAEGNVVTPCIDANGLDTATGAMGSLIGPGANFGISSEYNINNNIIMLPPTGEILAEVTNNHDKGKFTIASYTPTTLLSAKYGNVTAKNNVIDWNGYKNWSAGNNKDENGEYTWLTADTLTNFTLEEAGLTFESFYDSPNHNYILEKSNKLYTMADGQPIGAEMMYVDAFPVAATLAVNIEGSRFVDYTIQPVKEKYFDGDEVTIILNDHNSKYRTFNTFKGWSDGNTEKTRKITIQGETTLTAQYEEAISGLVSAFDFSSVLARNNKLEELTAEINASEDAKAVVHGFAIDADSDESNEYVQCTASAAKQTFQAVLNKFGEDDADAQMNVLSRRSSDLARAAQKLNYAQFEISTKGMTGIGFSCYVGGDNLVMKTQKAEYSIDGGNTFTEFAKVDIEQRPATFIVGGEEVNGNLGGWTELKGTLPADAEGLDKLCIRVIGDATSEPIWSVPSLEETKDTGILFEYIGNVIITAATNLSGIENVKSVINDTNAPVYNVMGMKVDKNARGLLIKSGKKFFVK